MTSSISERRNFTYGVAGFVCPSILLLIAIPVYIAAVGGERFGLYFLITSLSGTVGLLDMGIGAATLRYLAYDLSRDDADEARSVLDASVFYYLFLATVSCLATVALAPLLASVFAGGGVAPSEVELAFQIGAFQLIPAMATIFAMSVLKACQRFDLAAWTTILVSVGVYGGGIAISLITGPTLTKLVIAALIGSACAALISCGFVVQLLRSRLPGYRVSIPKRATYERLIRFGIYSTLNSVSAFLLYHVQRYIVGATLGPAALAAYQVAQTIPAKAHALVNSGAEILFPRASVNGDIASLRKVYVRVIGASIVLSCLVLAPLWFFGELLLKLWVGAEIAEHAGQILRPMIVGYFMVALSPAPYHVLNGTNKPYINTIAWASCAALNLALLLGLSLHGLTLMGVAMAFAISNVVIGIAFQTYAEYVLWHQRRLLSKQST